MIDTWGKRGKQEKDERRDKMMKGTRRKVAEGERLAIRTEKGEGGRTRPERWSGLVGRR